MQAKSKCRPEDELMLCGHHVSYMTSSDESPEATFYCLQCEEEAKERASKESSN